MDVEDELNEIALEAVTDGIHRARSRHRIISTIATRADSAMLAQAAMEALRLVGLKIAPRNA